jgi:LmbE family N-acetylglucosaminyl deacetylase
MLADSFSELKPKTVLGVAAHPDDLDFGAAGAAGTLAKFCQTGANVYYLILTDGRKGSPNPKTDPKQLAETRKKEQEAAAKVLGVRDVIFFDYEDCALVPSLELKRDIVKVIRKLKPEVVVTMDPSMLYYAPRGFINHPDHRAAGQATLDAVFPMARDCLTFPDLCDDDCMPHKVQTVLLTSFEKQNFVVDISSTIDQKLAAISAHASQVPDLPATLSQIKDVAADIGAKNGCAFAESFVRIDIQANF